MAVDFMKKAAWLGVFVLILIWSAIGPKDYLTWFLEVIPAVIALIILAATQKTFPLTPLAYLLILIHSVILMIGGHYTYAEVPFGDLFSTRNNYDKIGHLAQGFIPALIAREILLRKAVVASKKWLNFFIITTCLAISAFYELIEWWVALLSGESAEAFLGTQGYIWDTQSDMFMALLGAIICLVVLSRIHNRQLTDLPTRHNVNRI
jgi:putative membrane protein